MKNLIYICINGLRSDSVTEEKMKNLYAFSKKGTLLSNVISSHPIEESYFATLLTGKPFTSTGAFRNGLRINPDHDTFPKALTDNGYQTAFIGNWPLYGAKPFVPKGRYRMGFDDIFVTLTHRKDETFLYSDYGDRQPVNESEASAVVKVFGETVSRFNLSGSPFAVFISLSLPVSKRVCYDSAVSILDGELSPLFCDRENTVTVVTSSYGTLIGKDEKAYSEISVNVPFIMSCGESQNSVVSTLVGTEDIMPSLLAVLSVPAPIGIPGKAKNLLSSVSSNDSVMLVGTGPVDIFKDGSEWRGLRSERFTYIITKKNGTEYLFDCISDPRHENNLSPLREYDEIRSRMKRELYGKMLDISDTFANNSYYKKYWLADGKIKPVLK